MPRPLRSRRTRRTGPEVEEVANGPENSQIVDPARDHIEPVRPRTQVESAEYLQAQSRNSEAIDAAEMALAEALTRASAAGEWGLVAQLAKDLEARRMAREAPEVVKLDAARRRREL
jgi:hypothetical protein